ncbi:SRPBCC family protein [Natrinema gelatinilyticum]|uniref:SRPBCC family protein n=1 Tax=Natrinema gelatinilyticum TaxID=2961571 RepID=UPI0020C24282|nr:carbon monoxide dehydrogenase subunit G [Natrinema gelatinilyticum]
MEIEDQITVNAPRDVVVEEMQEPEVLQEVLPNCEDVTQVDEQTYIAKVSERISMVSLDMEVDIEIEDYNPPESFTVAVDGTAPGSNTDVAADTYYGLSEAEDSGTVIDYQMDIEVSGKLASLGFRMLKSTVNKRIDQMAENIEAQFAETSAA